MPDQTSGKPRAAYTISFDQDALDFIKTFSKRWGLTPSEYINRGMRRFNAEIEADPTKIQEVEK